MLRMINKKILVFYVCIIQIFIFPSFNSIIGLCDSGQTDNFIISINPINNTVIRNYNEYIISWDFNETFPLSNETTNFVINCSSDFFKNVVLMNVTGDITNIRLLIIDFNELFEEYNITILSNINYNFSIWFLLNYKIEDEFNNEIFIYNIYWNYCAINLQELIGLIILFSVSIIVLISIVYLIHHRSCKRNNNKLNEKCVLNKKNIINRRGLSVVNEW